MTYKEFITGLRAEIWTHPGEAQSLKAAHTKFFLEAVIDLCKTVACLQEHHTDIFPACSTLVDCGKTVFDDPARKGVIKRVYTIVNGDHCTKVLYDPSNFHRIDSWSRNLLSSFRMPSNAGLPSLALGLRYAEASTDSPYGRSRAGLWCRHNRRLYLVPWLQSNESLVIEWDGVKTDWKDDDVLDAEDWTADVAAVIKRYVQWCHQRDFGQADTAPGEERMTKGDYEEGRADLIWWCRTRTIEREAEAAENRLPTVAERKAELPVAITSEETVFAMVGDFGQDTAVEGEVADLIKSWEPSYVVTLGDNWYGSEITLSDLDAKVGQYFQEFLFPYMGSYGDGASGVQRFFPCIGNHDRDPDGRLDLEMQYFNLSSSYYTFVQGAVQFFVYDAGYDSSQVNQQIDGIAVGTKQANWLRAQLALSTARFKIVLLHQPPFSSCASGAGAPLAGDGTLSYPALRLPFREWGADLVMSGHAHNYERLVDENGFTYLVNGAGGRDGSAPGEPAGFRDPALPTSLVRYAGDFGAIKGRSTCTTLILEFWSLDGTLVDTVKLSYG